MSARERLEERLRVLPGLARRPSRHGDGFSYFASEREIAHFHGDERLDVRLTRERIPELRATGLLDSRVTTRGPSAHWVAVRLADDRDVPLALLLVEEALRSNA